MACLPAASRGHSQPLSICQSGRDCQNEFQSIKLPATSPVEFGLGTVSLLPMLCPCNQSVGEVMVSPSSRCPYGLHLFKQRRGHSTGCKFPEVHWSRSATKLSHEHVKATDFFCLFAAGINQWSWTDSCEIYIHSYVMCKGHTVSCLCRNSGKSFETRVPCMSVTLFIIFLKRDTTLLMNTLFFIFFLEILLQ